ncbi:Pentatricopeptide repeat-containing protein [Spatholobus suberectus]|nr:Pentatricopeptide repeat-containing protein [Spatholobus suberectus]
MITRCVENKFCKHQDLCQPVTGHPCPGSDPFSPAPPFFPLSSISTLGSNSVIGATAREVAAGAALLFTPPESFFMVVLKENHKNFSLMCMAIRFIVIPTSVMRGDNRPRQ